MKRIDIEPLVSSHLLSVRLLRAIAKLSEWITNIEEVAECSPFGLTEFDVKRIERYKRAARKNFQHYIALNANLE